MQVFTETTGLLFLVSYGAIMIGLTWWFGMGHKKDQAEFLLAGRNVGVLPAALSIAASWIWAPALFLSSQKAYQQGLAGAFWFTVPNVLSLVFFAFLAFRIRKKLPNGYTLPQFMRARHGPGVHILYMIQFFVLQICSFAVQIIAGAKLISLMTGLSLFVIADVLVVTALIYSVLGGVRASILTDMLQMGIILLVSIITVPLVVWMNPDGWSAVSSGMGGPDGSYGDLFSQSSLSVAYAFGIPVTIGLIAGPIGDQMHWQRAFAIRSDRAVIWSFVLAGMLFLVVPVLLAILGFVAGGSVNGGVVVGSGANQVELVGAVTVYSVLGTAMAVVFAIMLLSGLCSTLDSILCAASALASVDLLSASRAGEKTADADESSAEAFDLLKVWIARLSMLLTAFVGLAIALHEPKIENLFLFYGTWRASTMIPTILSLYWQNLSHKAVFLAILISLLTGGPAFIWGVVVKGDAKRTIDAAHLDISTTMLGINVSPVNAEEMRTLFPKDNQLAVDRDDLMKGIVEVQSNSLEVGEANSSKSSRLFLYALDGKRIYDQADLRTLGKQIASDSENAWNQGQTVELSLLEIVGTSTTEAPVSATAKLSSPPDMNDTLAEAASNVVIGDYWRVGGILGVIVVGLFSCVGVTLAARCDREWWREGYAPPVSRDNN